MSYTPPSITRIASISDLTRTFCIKDKTLSRDVDGTTFFGFTLPIGDCPTS